MKAVVATPFSSGTTASLATPSQKKPTSPGPTSSLPVGGQVSNPMAVAVTVVPGGPVPGVSSRGSGCIVAALLVVTDRDAQSSARNRAAHTNGTLDVRPRT